MATTSESNICLGKKKKVSKKSKRSWRKFTDIKDVEEHLEEVRREERTGGPVAEKPDRSLFFLDKQSADTEKDSSKSKRTRKRKLLKCDQLLLPDSRIKTIGSKKRKLANNVKIITAAKQSNFSSDSSEDEEDASSKPLLKETRNDKKRKETPFDLWGSKDNPTGDYHYLRVTGKKTVKIPKTAKRQVTELPAIDACHPGASYNPAFEDHQDLLKCANEIEEKKKKKIEKLDRKIKYLTKEEAASLPTWEEEMGEGLFDDGKDEDKDDVDDEEEEESITEEDSPAKDTTGTLSRKKLRQHRKKQAEEKEKQKEVDADKELKLKENEVFRIKSLKKEITAAELEAEKRKEKKDQKKQTELKNTRKLGRYTYVKPDVEIQLSSEITGNLRKLKQEGNLFKDRFSNLQKRNMIEPRVPVIPHRKYALKEYDRRSYKKACINELGDTLSSKRKK